MASFQVQISSIAGAIDLEKQFHQKSEKGGMPNDQYALAFLTTVDFLLLELDDSFQDVVIRVSILKTSGTITSIPICDYPPEVRHVILVAQPGKHAKIDLLQQIAGHNIQILVLIYQSCGLVCPG